MRVALLAVLALLCTCRPAVTWMDVCWNEYTGTITSYEGECIRPVRIAWERMPVSVYVEPVGGEDFQPDIRAAVALWRGYLVLTPEPSADVVVAFGAVRPGSSAGTQIYRDFAGRQRAWVECRRCVMRGQAADLLGHEFGHVLGLDHDLEPSSIMHRVPPHPLSWRRRAVQAADWAALETLYGKPRSL